ncbi:MAG: tetratricopeptide repeat protein [Calditrichaeota bacterium]|nr:MAG: tetratricopeptide repeat protein [Calditrichota bacterium]
MKKRLVFIALFAMLATQTLADEATTYFVKGNKAYESGDFAAAIANYEHVISLNEENWHLYFNLGNAYFRSNNLGRAILNYERAFKLAPENEDVQFNLEMAALQTTDRIPLPPKEAYLVLLENWFNSPSFSFLLYTTLILYATFILGWALRYFVPAITGAPFYQFFVVTALVLFLFFASIFSLRWYNQATKQFGVILEKEVNVTSSPTTGATELFILHEGTKFQIKEQASQWLRIRLRDGKTGWITAESAGRI